MTRHTAPHLPFHPLAVDAGPDTSDRDLAVRYGTTERTIYRWRRHGIPAWRADELAVTGHGLHPLSLWGDAWLMVTDRPDKET